MPSSGELVQVQGMGVKKNYLFSAIIVKISNLPYWYIELFLTFSPIFATFTQPSHQKWIDRNSHLCRHCHHRRLFQHFRRFSASFHHRTHFPISLASDQKYERGGWSSSSSFGRSIISIRTKKNLKVTEIGLRRLEKDKAAVGCQAAADMIPGRTRPQRPIHQSTLICGTGLPLASNRWVRLSLSRLCPLV